MARKFAALNISLNNSYDLGSGLKASSAPVTSCSYNDSTGSRTTISAAFSALAAQSTSQDKYYNIKILSKKGGASSVVLAQTKLATGPDLISTVSTVQTWQVIEPQYALINKSTGSVVERFGGESLTYTKSTGAAHTWSTTYNDWVSSPETLTAQAAQSMAALEGSSSELTINIEWGSHVVYTNGFFDLNGKSGTSISVPIKRENGTNIGTLIIDTLNKKISQFPLIDHDQILYLEIDDDAGATAASSGSTSEPVSVNIDGTKISELPIATQVGEDDLFVISVYDTAGGDYDVSKKIKWRSLMGLVTVSSYQVSVQNPSAGGTAVVDASSFAAGGTVTVTVTSTGEHEFNQLIFTNVSAVGLATIESSLTETTGPGSNPASFTFEMPNEDVVLSPQFDSVRYQVTVGSAANGSISLSQSLAALGTPITITVSPDSESYALTALTASNISSANQTYFQDNLTFNSSNGTYRFLMPGEDFTLTPTFSSQWITNLFTYYDNQGDAAAEPGDDFYYSDSFREYYSQLIIPALSVPNWLTTLLNANSYNDIKVTYKNHDTNTNVAVVTGSGLSAEVFNNRGTPVPAIEKDGSGNVTLTHEFLDFVSTLDVIIEQVSQSGNRIESPRYYDVDPYP